MDAQEQANVKAMISAALGKAVATPGVAAQGPTEPAQAPVHKNEPTHPSEVPLDEYEALMVEALGWRVEASEKTNLLLNTEKTRIEEMKNNLLRRCVNRLKVDMNHFNIVIDSGTGMIKIQRRG